MYRVETDHHSADPTVPRGLHQLGSFSYPADIMMFVFFNRPAAFPLI
jgi:hypothetical protein